MKKTHFLLIFIFIWGSIVSASVNSEASEYYNHFKTIMGPNPNKQKVEKIQDDILKLVSNDKIDPQIKIGLEAKLLETKRRLNQVSVQDYIEFQKSIDADYILPEYDLERSLTEYLYEHPEEISQVLPIIKHVLKNRWPTPLSTSHGIDRIFPIFIQGKQSSAALELCSVVLQNDIKWQANKYEYVFEKLFAVSSMDNSIVYDSSFKALFYEIIRNDPIAVCTHPLFRVNMLKSFEPNEKQELLDVLAESLSHNGIVIADQSQMAATLQNTSSGDGNNWVLKVNGGEATYRFDYYGYLTAIRDRNNNGLNLTYQQRIGDPTDKILTQVQATAPDSRYFTFTYEPDNPSQPIRKRRVTRISCSWNGKYSDYFYNNGLLYEVKDANGRTNERYDHSSPSWYEFGEDGFDRHLSVQRPNSNGDLITYATYVTGNLFSSENWGKKFDGAGTPLIWFDYLFGAYRDISGLGVYIEGAYGLHNMTPARYQILDFNRSVGDEVVSSFFVDINDTLFGGMNAASLHPNKTYKASGDNYYVEDDENNVAIEYEYWGEATATNLNDFSFNRLKTKSEKGKIPVHYFYDSNGRPTGTWIANDRFTSNTFDIKGNLISSCVNGERFTTYTLDSYGRVVTKTTSLGTVTYEHNNWGHVTKVTDEEGFETISSYDSRGLLTSTTARGLTTTFEYDVNDRLTTTTDHIGNKSVTLYTADDNIWKKIDPVGNAITYSCSTTSGTLSSVTDAEGGTISFEYDLLGNITKVSDQRGNPTIYTYDAFGRVVEEKNALNQIKSYTYDDSSSCGSCGGGGTNGNLASITDYAGKTKYFKYDVADRLTTVTYSGLPDKIIYTYDSYGRKSAVLDTRLPISEYPTQTFTYEYDKFDNITKEIYPDGEEVVRSYDINGRLIDLEDPDGNVTEYIYANTSSNKKLSRITSSFGGNIDFSYNLNGLPFQQWHVNSGAGQQFEYDSLNRIEVIANFDSSINEIYRSKYYFNPLSLITRQDISRQTSLWSYKSYSNRYLYDDAYRLVQEDSMNYPFYTTRQWGNKYSYDLAGNRTQVQRYNGVSTQTTSLNYNSINQIDNTDYEYDLNGNLVKSLKLPDPYYIYKSFEFNRDSMLANFGEGEYESMIQYVYDYSGRLLCKIDTNSVTKTKNYYDGSKLLHIKSKPYSASCYLPKTSFVLKQTAIGQIIQERDYSYSAFTCSAIPSMTDRIYHYDHIGNVVGLSDSSGYVIDTFETDAFGVIKNGNQNNIGQTTKLYDSDMGLYNFGARWYDTGTGRWLSQEPFGFDKPNLYHYSYNNPLFLYDHTGLKSVIKGGNAEQRSAVNEAFDQSCKDLSCKWNPSKIPPGADPRVVDMIKNCLERTCKSNQPINIGGIFCPEDNSIDGYTHCGPLNPFCGEGGEITVCPDVAYGGAQGQANSYLGGVIMHELSHNCGAGENWAYSIGEMFW